jgi:hypothetical protein
MIVHLIDGTYGCTLESRRYGVAHFGRVDFAEVAKII